MESVEADWLSGPTAGGIERFRFEIDWADSDEIVFAVSYESGGQTVWDNNFGRDYWLERP